MRHLTEWEVEEFIDEVSHRPTQWMGREKLWVRKRDGENQLAVKFKNGLPDNMSTVHVAKLGGNLTEHEIDYYVEWMMKKFTGYGFRLEVEATLRRNRVEEASIETIAREIATPRNHKSGYTAPSCLERTIARVVEEVVGTIPATPFVEASGDAQRSEVVKATNPPPLTSTPPAKRSKYLQKLLGEVK